MRHQCQCGSVFSDTESASDRIASCVARCFLANSDRAKRRCGAPLVFHPCAAGLQGNGEPPASDNGVRGACEAAMAVFTPSGSTCQPPQGKTYATSANCPFMPALAQRLDSNPLHAADPICRCQNSYQSATYQVAGPTSAGPTTYDVRVTLNFGAATQTF